MVWQQPVDAIDDADAARVARGRARRGRHLDRHGETWPALLSAVGERNGWATILARYAAALVLPPVRASITVAAPPGRAWQVEGIVANQVRIDELLATHVALDKLGAQSQESGATPTQPAASSTRRPA